MGFFSKIKDAVFGHKAAAAQPSALPTGGTSSPTGSLPPSASSTSSSTAQNEPVDVEQVLSRIADSKGNPELNYRSSIVDLMKLLNMNPSLENRRELADELGFVGNKDNSAEMNVWLHKEVMRQLAANGGKVPASMME